MVFCNVRRNLSTVMVKKEIEIINKLGLHARAAAKFVTLASVFDSDIQLERNGKKVNGKSIMGVMMLAAGKGSQLTIIISGNDENEALLRLGTLVAERFGEEE